MSEAGDDIPIDETPQEEQVEVTATDAPKGKLSVEDALQVDPNIAHPFLDAHNSVTP